ncbi:MAG: response regulator transcription factor [Candidatus Riflebacteria bacterium]|nr:response regulator transcription factor [Candidatus Riflebacteria bacterium]
MSFSTAKIGIVDDDQKLIALVTRYLQSNGFSDVHSFSPTQLATAENIPADLLILDIMMPDLDGFELLKRIRKKSRIPVIFLSAKSEVFDRIIGLELGADDYLTKPFEPRELLARIQAILRRNPRENISNDSPGNDNIQPVRLGLLEFEEFIFNLDNQVVCVGAAENQLTTYEFQLLRLFCDNIQIILSRQQIMTWMERNEFGSYDRSIDVGISRLRRKIEKDPGKPELLRTVWGRGYQLVVRKKKPST